MTNFHLRLILIVCCGLTACSQQDQLQPPASAATTPRPPLVVTDELRARLASADAADGKVDHVIEKCILCDLHMSGKPQLAVPVGDYSAHLCSAACQKAFANDPAKALLALKPAER
jgi:hypothetical protein